MSQEYENKMRENPPPYTAGPADPGPPHAGVPPSAPSANATFIHIGGPPTATVVVMPALGSKPTMTTCRSCHASILTRVDYKPTMRTHLCAAILCLFICWPCACLPYCMDTCQNAEHYCPNCGAYIGTNFN